MKKLVVLLLVVVGLAFLAEPTGACRCSFLRLGCPFRFPVFYGPGYYGPGTLLLWCTVLRLRLLPWGRLLPRPLRALLAQPVLQTVTAIMVVAITGIGVIESALTSVTRFAPADSL